MKNAKAMKMKTLFLISLLFSTLISYSQQVQVLSNDTVICVIDTTKSYTEYDSFLYSTDTTMTESFDITIWGEFFMSENSNKSIPRIFFFDGTQYRKRYVKGNPAIVVARDLLDERYTVVDDHWIQSQKNLEVIMDKIGVAPFSKYNYITFSQDYYNTESDSITLYRVIVAIITEQ